MLNSALNFYANFYDVEPFLPFDLLLQIGNLYLRWSFQRKSSPEADVSMRSEMEFCVKSEPELDITMENKIEPDNMTERELETGVQAKSEPETVWVKSEPAHVWMKKEPEAVIWIKSEPEADNEQNMEFKTGQETEFEIGCGTKAGNLVVRIVICS